MRLTEAQPQQTYKIITIHCTQEELLQRLHSFGIYENTIFILQYTSLQKHTFGIYINGMQVALRKTEAELIEIQNAAIN